MQTRIRTLWERSWFVWTTALMLIGAILLCCIHNVYADAPIQVDFVGVSTASAYESLFKASGKSYAIGAGLPGAVFDMHLTGCTFDQAIKVLQHSTGTIVTLEADVYIVSNRPEPVLFTGATTEPIGFQTTSAPAFSIEKITLLYADATQLLDILKGTTDRASPSIGMSLMPPQGGMQQSYGTGGGYPSAYNTGQPSVPYTNNYTNTTTPVVTPR